MKIKYDGPYPHVVVWDAPGRPRVEQGKSIDVDDELGARLVEQDVWSVVEDVPLDRMKVGALRDLASERGLDPEGTKAELLERLTADPPAPVVESEGGDAD